MSLPKFVQKTVSAVFNSPLLQAFGMGDLYNVLNEHFVLSAQEVTQAYQKSYAYALSAIAAGLASDESWRGFWQKIMDSKVEYEFSSQIVDIYLEPFAEAQGLQGSALDEFRQQAIQDCQALAVQKEMLFQIAQFQLTEAELAALVNASEIATVSELVIAHLQSVAETQELLSEPLTQFLAYHNLLGYALLFFLNEELRDNERFKATLDNLRQQGLLAEIQDLQQAQSGVKTFFNNKLTAIEQQLAIQNQRFLQAATPTEFAQIGQQSKTLLLDKQAINETLAEIPQRLQQLQSEWQTTQAALSQFSQQFSQWVVFASTQLETIVAALPDLQYRIEQLDDKVDVLLDGQEKLSEAQQRLFDELHNLAARLEVSSQIKPQDEFTQYHGATEVKLRQAIAQFKNLPNYLDYPQITLQVGSLSSVLGDLKTAERLFFDIEQNSQNNNHRASACMNLFHIYLRNGPTVYHKALKYLKKAILLNRAKYVLHNVDLYPIQGILGVGGMGCVFLCHNSIEEERLGKECLVVVKCLWESQRGEPNKIFAEPLAMAKIAGESVPQPLSYGYVDIAKQERAYFVTEFIEGAMDGEAWLAKQGQMDLITGVRVGIQVALCLQKAHEQSILHLDLKPANLLLKANDSGLTVKIIDFGLARIATSLRQHAALARTRSAHSQLAQQVFGTFDYAPPEQRGDLHYSQVTEKSDVFALGKTLYRLFSGKRPQDNIRQKYLPDAPGLHELLEDCVESDPADRPNINTVLTSLTALLLKKTAKSIETEDIKVTDNPQQVTEYQAEEKQPIKERQTEPRRKSQATAQKYPKQTQKKPEDGSQVKPIIISLVLLALGFILSFAIFLLLPIFKTSKVVAGSIIIIGLLFYVLLVGQYFWRHRQTMPHLAMVFGLIGIGWGIWLILMAIFNALDISFLGSGKAESFGSGAIVGLSLAILLIGQYLRRHRQTMPLTSKIIGLVGIYIGMFFILAILFLSV
jgi:serine/threonine protein kinase